MVQRCVVVGCNNGYKPKKVKSQETGDKENKVSYFRFPRSDDDRKEWIRRIKRDGWVPTTCSRVCSDHFEPQLIETERTSDRAKKEKGINRVQLKPKEGAVPTLKLGHNDPSAAVISPRCTQGAKLRLRDQAKELKFAEDQKKQAEHKAKRNEVTELNHLYAFLEKSPRPKLVILPGPNGELNILRHLLSPPRVVSSLEANPQRVGMAVRDRPFERTVTLHKDSGGHVGFTYRGNKITGIAVGTSAARNGLLVDHAFLEINGQNVVELKEKEMKEIFDGAGQIVTLTIMPWYIYEHMLAKMATGLLKKVMDHSIPEV